MRTHLIAICAFSILGLSISPASAAEVCGDGLDNDTDGYSDEGCWPVRSVCEDPLSCALTGAVAPKMGSVVYAFPPDFAPRSAWGPSIGFRRTLVSHYRPGTGAGYRNPFGNLMVHNWLSWIDKSGSTAIVRMPSGRDVLFTYASTGAGWDQYTPQTGVNVDYLRQSTSSPYEWELRTLTGEVYVYNWSSPTGKLIEVHDSLASPGIVTVSYDGSGRVQYVTDAPGTKRLKFTYNGSDRLTKVEFQTIASGTATTRSFSDYSFNNNQLQNYQPNSCSARHQCVGS